MQRDTGELSGVRNILYLIYEGSFTFVKMHKTVQLRVGTFYYI